MSVKYIKYNEKKYPVKLGVFSLQEMQNKEGIDLSDMETNISLYKPVLFLALQLGARIKKEPLELLEEDMDLVLDECMVEFSLMIPEWIGIEVDAMEKLMAVDGQKKEKKGKKTTPKSTSTKSTAKE